MYVAQIFNFLEKPLLRIIRCFSSSVVNFVQRMAQKIKYTDDNALHTDTLRIQRPLFCLFYWHCKQQRQEMGPPIPGILHFEAMWMLGSLRSHAKRAKISTRPTIVQPIEWSTKWVCVDRFSYRMNERCVYLTSRMCSDRPVPNVWIHATKYFRKIVWLLKQRALPGDSHFLWNALLSPTSLWF